MILPTIKNKMGSDDYLRATTVIIKDTVFNQVGITVHISTSYVKVIIHFAHVCS